jgi:outer membrane immunogenic protein
MIHRLLLASAATVALMGAPKAADLPYRAAPLAPAVLPVFTWTGCYVGVHVGHGSGPYKWIDPADGFDAEEPIGRGTHKGFLGGGQVGCNYQFGQFVVGSETDFSVASVKGSFIPADSLVTYRSKLDFLSTSAIRAGIAIDRTLIFVKGGFAIGRMNHSWADAESSSNEYHGPKETRVGFVVGGGVEYAFTQNWSAKLEYNYVDFGKRLIAGQHNDEGILEDEVYKVANRVHLVKVGLNYKFW